MSDAQIELSDVEVRRGGKVILKVPRLVVARGTFLGIVGANGAGKTTLLEVCAGLTAPTRGTACVLGRHLETLSGWARTHLRRRIGFVPQRADYYPDVPLTVREVVSLGRVGPRGLLRRLTRRDRELVTEWIDKLGLSDLAGRAFRSLSGGERQKVLIARAMTQQPSVLLLDEPAANLDIDWKEKVVGLLAELYRRTALTVVMVSHETGLLPECTSQVALMRSGEILRAGSPDEVFTTADLSTAYGCPIEVVRLGGRFHALSRGRAGAEARKEGLP